MGLGTYYVLGTILWVISKAWLGGCVLCSAECQQDMMGVMYAALSVAALLREAALKIETHTFMGNHKYIDICSYLSIYI